MSQENDPDVDEDDSLDLVSNEEGIVVRAYIEGGDNLIAQVEKEVDLQVVWCNRSRITDAGLERLALLPKLQEIWIESPNVTPEGIRLLKQSRLLTSLALEVDNHERHKVGEFLAAVSELKQLKELSFDAPRISGECAEHFSRMVSLERLSLTATDFSDEDAAALPHMSSLRVLSLSSAKIGDVGCESICRVKKLRKLDLGNTKVTNAGIERLADCKDLESICVSHTLVDDNGLFVLAKGGRFASISAVCTSTGDGILNVVRASPNLTYLNIAGSKVSQAAYRQLKREFPKLKID